MSNCKAAVGETRAASCSSEDRASLARPSRRLFIVALPAFAVGLARRTPSAAAAEPPADRFDFLSANGNSNCSKAFMDSIAGMPADARLQGSCCSPMDRARYRRQIRGLKAYASITSIPDDPYDISAELAKRLMSHYDDALAPTQQAAYQHAMDNSDERGPCCCQCWRWRVYGGLAKLLIAQHGFTGEQIVDVWNLSDGCGGA